MGQGHQGRRYRTGVSETPVKVLRRLRKDRVAAVLMVLLGAGIVAQALTYRMGELTRMGAGF